MFRAWRFDSDSGNWQRFSDPRQVYIARDNAGVLDVIRQVEAASLAGHHVVGFVTYEAASAFDTALAHHAPGVLPLAAFAVFGEPESCELPPTAITLDLLPTIERQRFTQAIDAIKAYQRSGETYQVNFTHPLSGQLQHAPLEVLASLTRFQAPPYACLIETEDYALISLSPELFFKRRGRHLQVEPMKGTRPRGRFAQEDKAIKASLAASEKDRAENLMIVDMIRNDLGRIANAGTICLESLFEIRKFPTVWQQISSISAESAAPLVEIFSALFPCASVTGAPKVRTMEIIRELETDARGIYTGTIGWLAPGGDCTFNVAIRTLCANKRDHQVTYGVGGGIVWDSEEHDEWQESLVKAAVLEQSIPDFELLETMLYQPGEGVFLMEAHLARLSETADYFDFPVDVEQARGLLAELSEPQTSRLRLLVNRHGDMTLSATPFQASDDALLLKLAENPVDSRDRFLFHKTTHRAVYELAKSERQDCDDVILFNERGELTETTIANLFLEIEGSLVTPPVSSGLLAGTFRQHLLRSGQATEQVLMITDLERAQSIYIGNSVRRLCPAVLVESVR